MAGVLTCVSCKKIFRSRDDLKNHVRRDHQSSVTVTFLCGRTAIIKRGEDGMFKCGCEKRCRLPNSMQRHAKSCKGESERQLEKEENAESVSEEEIDISEPMNREVDDIPDDCFGNCFLMKLTDCRGRISPED